MGIPAELSLLEDAVMQTLKANNLSDARIRITVSIGEGEMVPDPSTCGQPTVLITAAAYTPYPEQVYQNGFQTIISSIRRNSQSPISRLKSASYLESMFARQEARAAGVHEAVCLNDKGVLAEASMSNIFLVTSGRVRTPGQDSGILPGITREAVLELASQLNIEAIEHKITLDELFQAREAFLTNSLIEIMPLTEIDGRLIGSGRPGPVTQRLMAAYRELVHKETG
jgi:branched-subunit amino acid aminotransferase/4-amino-4-deoxychorismate lyase